MSNYNIPYTNLQIFAEKWRKYQKNFKPLSVKDLNFNIQLNQYVQFR